MRHVVLSLSASVLVLACWSSVNLLLGVEGGAGMAIRLAYWGSAGCATGYLMAMLWEGDR